MGSICGWNDKNEVPCIIHAGDITRLDGIKLLLSDITGFYPMYDFAVKIGAGMGVSCSFIGMAQVLSNIQAIPVWCDSLIPFKCFDKIAYVAKTTSIGYLCQG